MNKKSLGYNHFVTITWLHKCFHSIYMHYIRHIWIQIGIHRNSPPDNSKTETNDKYSLKYTEFQIYSHTTKWSAEL